MYGTKELNHKRLKLLKEFKGKFYAKHNGRHFVYGLIKVTGVIVDKDNNSMKLVFKEVLQKRQYNSMLGGYNELKTQRDMYFISPTKLGKQYIELTEKRDRFNIAESLD